MSLNASDAFSWIWECIESATSSAVLLNAAEAMLDLVPRDQSDLILQIMIITQRRFFSVSVDQDILVRHLLNILDPAKNYDRILRSAAL